MTVAGARGADDPRVVRGALLLRGLRNCLSSAALWCAQLREMERSAQERAGASAASKAEAEADAACEALMLRALSSGTSRFDLLTVYILCESC